MIVLDDTDKSLEVVISALVATTELDWSVSYVDLLLADMTVTAVNENDGQTNGTTPVTMIAAPAAGHVKQLKSLSIFNADIADKTIIIQINHGGTKRILFKGILATGDNLQYA